MNEERRSDRRPHELVVWGATGYTGRLVASAIADLAGDRRWAIAGRSRERLEEFRAQIDASAGSPPEIVVADLEDPDSLRRMTAATRVVLTTVGPYDIMGEPLVEACVATGTHVADITGEVPWVRRMRSRFEDEARAAGVRVVSMCGYDSVPSELGVRLLQQTLEEHHGRVAREIEMAVGPIHGGVSGGTIASASNMIARARDPEVRAGLRGAASLCVGSDSDRTSIRTGEQWGIRRSKVLDEWTAPFVMAGVNVSVVHRTHELLGRPWGRDFRYRECGAGGRGFSGLTRASTITLATLGLAGVLIVPPLRWIARRWFLPSPGQGPDEQSLRDGHFTHRTASADPPGRVEISAAMDPGYAATARMLLACGLCLLDHDVDPSIPDAFCTPGALFGPRLVPRLQSMGFEFRMDVG